MLWLVPLQSQEADMGCDRGMGTAILSTVVAAVAAVVAAVASLIVALRKRERVEGQLYNTQQERDDLRKKLARVEVRLDQIDPERFSDRVIELRDRGDFDEVEEASVRFAEAQSEAFGLAAEFLTEQRILDSEIHGAGAIEEAQRFARIGRAAYSDSKRLEELEKLAIVRSRDIEKGDPIEALNWQGLSGVELNQLPQSLREEGKYQLAEIAARRFVPLARLRTGEDSSNHSGALGQHANCLINWGHYVEAEPMSYEALRIDRKTLGAVHPDYAIHLNNLAGLLETTGRYNEAEPLYRRAVGVLEMALGDGHPNTKIAQENLDRFLSARQRDAPGPADGD